MSELHLPNVASMKRSGMVRSADLSDKEYLSLFDRLSEDDIKLMSSTFDHWSRRWEYPFAAHGIFHWLKKLGRPARILESGSGVTGVPFWFARLGHHVTGVDLDKACVAAWQDTVISGEGKAEFQLQDMEKLAFENNAFDVVYSVSAIEHTNHPAQAVSEMCRVLRPGGLLLLTCDVEPQGIGIPYSRFLELLAVLDRETEFYYQPAWCHPSEVLTFESRPSDTRSKLHKSLAKATHRLRKSGGRIDMAIYATGRVKQQSS